MSLELRRACAVAASADWPAQDTACRARLAGALRAALRADAMGTLTASAALIGFALAFGRAAALCTSRGWARLARM